MSSRSCSPIASPTSSSPPSARTWRAGRPVITAIPRTSAASRSSTSAAATWMWAALGSSTIGARVPSKSRATSRRRPARTTASYWSEPTAEQNSMAPLFQSPIWVLSVIVAGENDGEPVELHRSDGRLDPANAQVVGELGGGCLEPGGVVDGAGVDGAVPVVGAHDVPPAALRPGRGLAREPLDVGVV